MNVLVTGASGFIGRALCKRLLAGGWKVRGAVRSKVGGVALPAGVEAAPIGSICADTEWGEALGDIDTVVHLQYLDRYTPEQARRHEVRPGVTGWAQVNGRNARFICSFGFEMVF